MTKFYRIRHNTAYTQSVPEIYKIVTGLVDNGNCTTCGASRREPTGNLRVQLGKTNATFWPDAIACGEYPCFVVSERFVNTMREDGIRLYIGGVDFVGPNESGLSLDGAPRYYWIEGKKHFAGKMDFEASGFVDVRFCIQCGVRSDDIERTYDRQHATPPPPMVIDYDETNECDIFTTDLAPTAFFCTNRVFEAARKHKLTNLRFSPVEQGVIGTPMNY